ncbi:MAG: hypothetical protein IKF64_01845 [Eubacterium sp.]|nr:hypothetical protein [Eubacterium sp.]
MKKVISLCLSVVMLLSITAGLNLTAFAVEKITSLNIYNVDEPVAGEKPNFMFQQYDIDGVGSEYVDIDKDADDSNTVDGTSWYDVTAKSYVDPTDDKYVFICSHQYQIYVYLAITSGGGNVAFANPDDDNMNMRINGKSAIARESKFNFDDQYFEVSRKFTVVEHKLVEVPAKAATEKEAGNNAYYQCSVCKACFKDKDGKQETTPEKEAIAKLTPAPAPVAPADTATAPVTPVTKINLKKVTIKKRAKKLVLQATVKVDGKAVKGKKVTFKFNGKKYTAKTNKNGVAKVTIKKNVLKKLKVGKKVTYSVTYNKITAKRTVKVKK